LTWFFHCRTDIAQALVGDSTGQEWNERIADSELPPEYFSLVLGEDVIDGPPILTRAVQIFGTFEDPIKKHELVVVGNDTESMRQAQLVNLGFVAVANGDVLPGGFVEAGLPRDQIVASLNELPKCFNILKGSSAF